MHQLGDVWTGFVSSPLLVISLCEVHILSYLLIMAILRSSVVPFVLIFLTVHPK